MFLEKSGNNTVHLDEADMEDRVSFSTKKG